MNPVTKRLLSLLNASGPFDSGCVFIANEWHTNTHTQKKEKKRFFSLFVSFCSFNGFRQSALTAYTLEVFPWKAMIIYMYINVVPAPGWQSERTLSVLDSNFLSDQSIGENGHLYCNALTSRIDSNRPIDFFYFHFFPSHFAFVFLLQFGVTDSGREYSI